jgi:hypothetical protein
MESAQALMKFNTQIKNKAKTKPKTKPKNKAKIQNPNSPVPIMRISQREYDWYLRLCPNFNECGLHIAIMKT